MIQELTLSHKRQIIIALVLTIVYCKSFNVLFSNRRIVCGGNSLQSKLKFLKLPNFCSTFFIFLLFASNFSSFDLLRTAVPRKRVQRYGFNLKPPNISATFFKQFSYQNNYKPNNQSTTTETFFRKTAHSLLQHQHTQSQQKKDTRRQIIKRHVSIQHFSINLTAKKFRQNSFYKYVVKIIL